MEFQRASKLRPLTASTEPVFPGRRTHMLVRIQASLSAIASSNILSAIVAMLGSLLLFLAAAALRRRLHCMHLVHVTTSSGALQEIKIEGLAIGDTSWKFLDRDQSGYVVASHWAGGHSDWSPNSANHQTCGGAALSGSVLLEPGPDGIGDGYNILQGVRNYDPMLGQWSSPDAYAGDAADPGSEKAYMWNGNNPFRYEDPSGYDQFPTDPSGLNPYIWQRVRNPNPKNVRGHSGEWFRNSENSYVRFDRGTKSPWHGFRPDPRNPNQSGDPPVGPLMRDKNGKKQHSFNPGDDSPDFDNQSIYDCACGDGILPFLTPGHPGKAPAIPSIRLPEPEPIPVPVPANQAFIRGKADLHEA